MATACTTRSPLNDISIGEMNDFVASTFAPDAMSRSVSPQLSPRINLPPPPNPPFTFPAARHSISAPSSLSKTTGRRRQSAIDIPERKPGLRLESMEPGRVPTGLPDFSFNPANTLSPESAGRRPKPLALPEFSFNPGATSVTELSLPSPSLAPPSPRAIPTHMGHRRGGSEFVGGNPKSGEPITVMGTSPTRSEGDFASPRLAPESGPRRHQRGHSHRRSGAISSHDLSLILQASPNPSSRGNSAPASPAGFGNQPTFLNVDDQVSVGMTTTSAVEVVRTEKDVPWEKPSQSLPDLSPRPTTRARVGFSDTLEFIPRPLSLVSTDTASTVRPGHSVSGSISSIASITNPTTTEREPPAVLGSPVLLKKSSSRPRTAGAVLERTTSLHEATENTPSPRRRNSIPILNDLPRANSSTSALSTPTKTPKRWSFFGFETFTAAGSPTSARPASPSSTGATTREGTDAALYPAEVDNITDIGTTQDVSAVKEKKMSSKKPQKRVKTWAGSILTRKSKSRAQKAKARRRSQTPPIPRFAQDKDADFEVEEDAILPTPDAETVKHRLAHVEDEVSYPMIDLDAALGPFNTPTRDPQWEEAQRAGARSKRQLHSAAGMRGFSGPGMHYHRRTESAPEMPPFEGGRFSIHRFGSSSTMDDVFEEDEEEDGNSGESAIEDSNSDFQDTTTGEEDEGHDTDDAISTPTQEHNAGSVGSQSGLSTMPSLGRNESASSLDLPAPGTVRDETSSSSLHNEVIMEEQTSFVPARRENSTAIFSGAYDAAMPSPRRDTDPKRTTPPDATSIILAGPPTLPISPYPISHSSSFPSPRSPMSYDAQRISTAPSSFTDENNFRSLLMGEPGPEVVRLSVDVPSLTSTNSTMTRDSTFLAGARPRNMAFHEQRPASFTGASISSTAFGRRRSSLASLSRLISSAHGERSKLSMEVPFEAETEKKSKSTKSKRLSKMMQFWKPKASSGS